MGYCDNKKTAKIIYSFGGQKPKEKEFYDVPIQIIKSEVSDLNKKLINGGRSAPHGQGIFPFVVSALDVPSDATVWLISGTWDDYGNIGSYIAPQGQGLIIYNDVPIQIGSGNSVQGSIGSIVPIDCYCNVIVEFRWKGCKLEVFNKLGKKIFEDTGNCPIEFKVKCDDDCPPGHIKCKSNHYPGFCCIPCKFYAERIKNLVNKIK